MGTSVGHKPLYEDRSYVIRQENIYSVINEFPRIKESQIPEGVGDVRYSIILTDTESYRINDDKLFNVILDNEPKN